MADVTLTVDGKKLTAPAGTLLIEACKTVGIEVPSFCYYPNLSLQGACRMCLVEVEKMPKLQTACTTVISEGMIVVTDSDGNDIAGIRLPDVTVPLATYTGWALRSIANDGPDGCESTGQYIPFPQTQAARIAAGDPRLSVQERYGSFSGYYFTLLFAINDMVLRRLMLPEDAPVAFSAGLQKALASGSALQPKLHELGLLEGTGISE